MLKKLENSFEKSCFCVRLQKTLCHKLFKVVLKKAVCSNNSLKVALKKAVVPEAFRDALVSGSSRQGENDKAKSGHSCMSVSDGNEAVVTLVNLIQRGKTRAVLKFCTKLFPSSVPTINYSSALKSISLLL